MLTRKLRPTTTPPFETTLQPSASLTLNGPAFTSSSTPLATHTSIFTPPPVIVTAASVRTTARPPTVQAAVESTSTSYSTQMVDALTMVRATPTSARVAESAASSAMASNAGSGTITTLLKIGIPIIVILGGIGLLCFIFARRSCLSSDRRHRRTIEDGDAVFAIDPDENKPVDASTVSSTHSLVKAPEATFVPRVGRPQPNWDPRHNAPQPWQPASGWAGIGAHGPSPPAFAVTLPSQNQLARRPTLGDRAPSSGDAGPRVAFAPLPAKPEVAFDNRASASSLPYTAETSDVARPISPASESVYSSQSAPRISFGPSRAGWSWAGGPTFEGEERLGRPISGATRGADCGSIAPSALSRSS